VKEKQDIIVYRVFLRAAAVVCFIDEQWFFYVTGVFFLRICLFLLSTHV